VIVVSLSIVLSQIVSADADAQEGSSKSSASNILRRKRPKNPVTQQNQKIATQQTQRQHAGAEGQIQESVDCPEPYGFFADAEQCDKYYACEGGVATPKLCPDGLVFLEAGSSIEKCEFPFGVDCTSRPKFQNPKKSQNCPRKNGYFAHEDEKICDKFFYCVDGAYNAITCPAGLVFNDKTGTCTWPDQAKKSYCSSGELFDFHCPKLPEDQEGKAIHPRYADPKNCQHFFVCIDGKVPRQGGCSLGQVFNEKNGQCDKPKNVPECKDWYKGVLDYDEDGEIATTPRPKPKQPASSSSSTSSGGPRRKGSNRRPASSQQQRPRPVEDEEE